MYAAAAVYSYVASLFFVADSAHAAPNFDLKTIFSQNISPITPPNLWKQGRGTRDLSENLVIITENHRSRRLKF